MADYRPSFKGDNHPQGLEFSIYDEKQNAWVELYPVLDNIDNITTEQKTWIPSIQAIIDYVEEQIEAIKEEWEINPPAGKISYAKEVAHSTTEPTDGSELWIETSETATELTLNSVNIQFYDSSEDIVSTDTVKREIAYMNTAPSTDDTYSIYIDNSAGTENDIASLANIYIAEPQSDNYTSNSENSEIYYGTSVSLGLANGSPIMINSSDTTLTLKDILINSYN